MGWFVTAVAYGLGRHSGKKRQARADRAVLASYRNRNPWCCDGCDYCGLCGPEDYCELCHG